MKDNINIFNKLNESFEGSFKSKQPKKINEGCNKNLKEGVNDDVNEAWDILMNMGISEETLKIITSINGYNMETMEDVLYAAFGYRSFDQLEDEEDIDESCKMNEEEVYTDFIYELVGGEYSGTYTREEAEKLPILEPELSSDDSEIRNKGGLTHRKELDNQLQFKGYLGPMWNGTKDGKGVIRYETQEVYDMLSR